MNRDALNWRDAFAAIGATPLPPVREILDRLEVLWNKLESEGQYVRANTVALAIEAIRRSEAKP